MKFIRIFIKLIVTTAFALLLLIGYCTYTENLSTYKFGILKKEYPQYFKKDSKKLNPEYYSTIENINDYSPLTKVIFPFKDTFQIVSIEHLVRVTDYDLELLPEIKDHNHLFFALEFDKGNTNSVNVAHTYDGRELEAIATYIYHYPTKQNGEIDDNKKFKVTRINSDIINQSGRFVYVKIYKMPKLQSNWAYQHMIRQRYWFTKPIKEVISVKYADKGKMNEVMYQFDISWKIWSSFWSRVLTIT